MSASRVLVVDDSVLMLDIVRSALEDAGFGDAFELDGWLVFFVDGLELDLGGVGQERAGDQAGAISQSVETQQRMR